LHSKGLWLRVVLTRWPALVMDQLRPHRAGLPGEPSYPKMPGEPPRVQPSKKVDTHWDADGNPVTEK
jgi:hypothetical protein